MEKEQLIALDTALAGVLDGHPDQTDGDACALEVGDEVLIIATDGVAFSLAGGAASLTSEGQSGWAGGGLSTSHEGWAVDATLAGVVDGHPDRAGGEVCALEVGDDVLVEATDGVAYSSAGGAASLTSEGLSGWADGGLSTSSEG